MKVKLIFFLIVILGFYGLAAGDSNIDLINPDGKEISGIQTGNDVTILIPVYDDIYYNDKDYRLKSAKLLNNTWFDLADGNRILLKAGYRINFYKDGSLQSAILARDASFGNVGAFYAGTKIELYPDGKLMRAYILSSDHRMEILTNYSSLKISGNTDMISIKLPVDKKQVENPNDQNYNAGKSSDYNKPAGVPQNKLDPDKNLKDVFYYDSGIVKSGKLLSNLHFTLPGRKTILLKENTPVQFYENENLQSGTLAEEAVFNEIAFDAGTIIDLYLDGKFKRAVLKPKEKEAEPSFPEAKVVIEINNKIYRFRDSGLIKEGRWFRLAGDTVFSGILFKDNSILFLDSDNTLLEGQLARDQKIGVDADNSYWFKGGTVLSFYTNGNIKSGTLSGSQKINIGSGNDSSLVEFKKDTEITFYNDGNILSGFISGPARIKGVRFPEGSQVFFDSDGNTKLAKPSTEINIFGISYQPSSELQKQNIVLFYKNGLVRMALLSGSQYIDIVKNRKSTSALFKDGTYIEYYENGNVKNGILAGVIEIDGKRYPAGTYLEFDQEGLVTVVSEPDSSD